MTTNLAGASPVDQPVVRPDPEREEFERWAEENNFCTASAGLTGYAGDNNGERK